MACSKLNVETHRKKALCTEEESCNRCESSVKLMRERVVEKPNAMKTNLSPSKGTNIIGTGATGNGSKSDAWSPKAREAEAAIEFDDDLPPLEDLSLMARAEDNSDGDDDEGDSAGALAHFMQRPEDVRDCH